jgi:hypothetical protein
MSEHTLAVAVDRLYAPRGVAPAAYETICDLVREGCDGGDGEFDEPADTILRRMFSSNPIHEWDAASITSDVRFVVFYGLHIEFALTPYIKRCYLCKRVMAEHECGDETDEERLCDTCSAAFYASQVDSTKGGPDG